MNMCAAPARTLLYQQREARKMQLAQMTHSNVQEVAGLTTPISIQVLVYTEGATSTA